MAGKRKRRWRYLVVAAIIIAAFLVVKSRQGDGEEPVIRTADVERGTVTATVSANGILQPLTTVEVKSNAGGQVVKLNVDEGDEVKAGQLIAKIDPSDSETVLEQSQADLAAATSRVDQARHQLSMQQEQNSAQIESAKQGLEAARARLVQAQEQAQIQPRLTSSAIKQAESNLVAAQSALKQMKTALIPQRLSAAQAAYDQAKAGCSTAEKDLARQKELLSNGFVSKSQVETAQERYDVAKAQVDSAKRKLDTIKDETDQDLNTAEAKVEQAKAALENAQANSGQDKVKQQEVLSAKAVLKQAEASLKVAIASSYEDKIRSGDIVQAGAQVKRSQAAVKNASTQLGYTTIVAPRDGIVTKKYVEEGSIVTGGRSSFSGSGSGVALVDIADVSRMFAIVNVDETDIGQVEVGQDVDITVEAYPDELFTGKVTKVAPQSVTDQNVTTIPVTVEVDMPDKRLKPGMNVTCDFVVDRSEDVLMVPSEAIKDSDDGSTVIVIDKEKQITKKVECGLIGGDSTEIKSGLKEGEKVITAIIQPSETGTGANAGGPFRSRRGGMGGPGGMPPPH
jgi:HlyD family secretion protein